jgi:protein O-mannosyl-transferase
VTWLSHMLDAQMFGPGPAGPHVVNLLFHVANSVLLFLVLRGLTAAHWRSALVAALFALHPLHVESVAWVAERKDVLSTLFWLLSLWAYGRYARTRSRVEGRGSRAEGVPALDARRSMLDYSLALVFMALGLMAKPMLVTLPFVLLLLDYWPLQRVAGLSFRAGPWRRLILEKVPFFVLAAASGIVTFIAQQKAGAVNPLSTLTLVARLENAVISYARYLGKTFWPVHLAVPYPHPGHWPIGPVLLAIVLMAGLTAAAWQLRRRLPFLFTGWFWFVGTLVPVIGLVQVGHQSLADRYTYVPLIGIFIALAWCAAAVAGRARLPAAISGATALLILGACAARTMDQLRHWRNSETLFRHTIAAFKDSGFACDNLGSFLSGQGRWGEAEGCYREALRINARDPIAHDGLACCRLYQGHMDEAIAGFRRALELNPGQAITLFNLGSALAMLSQYDQAIECYRAALQLRPDEPDTLVSLGNVFFRQGRFPEAIENYRAALRLKRDYPGTSASLGAALLATGRPAEALDAWTAAVRLAPDDPEAHFGMGRALFELGRREEARARFRETLRLNPIHAEAKQALESASAAE